ncbi:MAG TPA: asparagine synthase (glutamine-hydrolyzing) [Chthoniobacterales bacterium]|nr:asparagine synthase (glutamine-hydrolyzing) [Chthoniobacterales bacterium]
MCGIAGFVGSGNREILRRMTGTLVHRGPDDCGYWDDGTTFLGFRRLSIVDLEGGHQPMSTVDGKLTLIFNGEIYNHVELRAELKARGHIFQTDHSDSEVLLHGYREWGAALPTRLNGMWAFAIYDPANATLFCSRDRFSKKPFYYAATSRSFVFGSELTTVAEHPEVNRNISPRALRKYFAYGYIPAPLSMYEGVHKLPGGCSLRLDTRTLQLRIERYWELKLEPFETIPANPEEEWGGRIRELLDRAVQRRLMADVPLGVFLSGGIDSSAVTAFASRHLPAGQLKTFSIGFDEKSFDESDYARRVATLFATDHHTEMLSLDRAHGLLDECLARLDEPLGDSSLLPTYLLNGFTRRYVTVALGGDGGDELFAGYDPFKALGRAKVYQALCPRPLHAGIRALFERLPVSHANMSLDFKIKRTLRGLSYKPEVWLPSWMGPLDSSEIAELFQEPIALEDLYSEAIEQWERCPQTNLIDKTLQFYTNLYLQDDIMVKTDRASMMHSLEVRAPFLDIELVDFVRRIPADYKLRHGTTKYILKKALEPVLPHDVLYRPKKGFGSPIGAWFKNGTLPSGDMVSVGSSASFIRERAAAHRAGKSDERALLWNAYVLNQWANHHGATATPLAA